MFKDIKGKIWHIVLTAAGLGLAAALNYIVNVLNIHFGGN